ncbi:MAG: hypothetical protein ACOC46_00090 [Pirellulales bacterium]
MKNLRRDTEPRNYLARGEQRRLLLLIVGLGAVLLIGWELRRGASFTRGLEALFGPQPVREGPFDTRLQAADDNGPPDAIFMPRDVEPPRDRSGEYFPGVRPGYLGEVRDDAFFRDREKDAWFHLLAILQRTDAEQITEASTGRASFAQLFQQSDDYRGRLVTLQGTARRAMPLDAPRNDYGMEQYWQVWLSPVDNPSSPIILYCLNLPDGFPTGMDIRQPITTTGFYFKRLAYEATDTLRTAPTVLVKTLRWTPPAPAQRSRVYLPLWAIVLIALAASAVVVAYVYAKTRSQAANQRDLPPPDFQHLAKTAPPEEPSE